MNFILTIKLLSAACPAGGEGSGGAIDLEVAHDDLGLPFIPARRIRGLLLESSNEVVTLLQPFVPKEKTDELGLAMKTLFGNRGQEKAAPLQIENGYLPDYEETRKWLFWFDAKFPKEKLVVPELVLSTFCSVRQQTALEDGVAKAGSLRVTRILNKGWIFESRINCPVTYQELLTLAVKGMRRLGSNRNRGLGAIDCDLLIDHDQSIIPEVLAPYREMLCGKEGSHE